ncbi:MAG TPA: carboxypeptidase regulatory-like domain-containing protein, partial [Lentimicrobium sp.]|nr:carboxypeptidase regulatory-like domain-containing protein [Lentimicrobium sp.]
MLMLLCLFLGFTVSAQDVLMTQSFENGGAMPAGWAKTTVSGSDALGFVTTSTNPSGFSPTDGSYMVRFNSYSVSSAVNRLYTTSYISTVAKENVTVEFSWLESTAYASSFDRVTVQWSPNGTTWFDGGTYDRPGAANAWVTIQDVLPAAAQNQPSLHIGFLFTSAYGNDCFIDDVTVTADNLAEPVTVTIGTGTGTTSQPFNTYWHDSRTQILLTAAEIIAAGGGAGDITTLGFNVTSAAAQTMNGFNIDVQTTTAATLTGVVESGWTNVYSGAHTAYVGWNVFTFQTPFDWDGTSNLIFNVCFDNTSYTSSSSCTYTTVADRTWYRASDGQTGCSMTGGSITSSRPNVMMTIETTPPLPISVVQGFVTNAYGIPIPGATVVADNEFGTFTTTSGPNGAYIIDDIYIGEYTMYAVKDGYNLNTINNVLVYEGQTTYQNIALTQPSMAITPNPYTVTLNPNEYYTGAFNIMNNGNGPLDWAATIEFMENDKSAYPIYTSVPVHEVENSPNRAPAGTVPYDPTGELNNPSKDPTDIAYGYVAYALGGLTESPCSFMLNNPGQVTNFGSAAADFISAADYVGDIWYGAIYGGSQFMTIDPVTGAYTILGSTGDFVGMSYNGQNETMYGLSYAGTLYTVNLANGQATAVGPTGTSGFIAFEIDNDGIGYAVNLDTDQLGTINLETGQWTSIGPVGFNASYAQDMSCDHSTNELYWAAYDAGTSQGKLLLVNKTNGSSQLIGTFPGGSEIDGFAIPGSAGGGWLTLGSESGTVNAFSNYNLPAYFNAEDTEAGEVYTATVTFTSDPNVGTIAIPVTMVIAGPPLSFPTDLSAVLTDPFIGSVNLSWSFQPSGDFINFVIKRDNQVVGYSTTTSFTDILPGYGLYNYTVQAVFVQGESLPAGPVELEWPNPTIMVDPTYIYDEVWVNHQKTETVTINNTGEGTLSFVFPAWVNDEGGKEPLAYCSASGGCDERISSVVFNTINNVTGCSGYADYTSISTELQMGQTYSLAVTNSVPYSTDIVGVWIDWNHNESFTDAGEYFATVSAGGASFSADITVPNTAMKGATRMRIRLQYGGTLAPCDNTSYGEVEDYTVNVVKTTGFIVGVHPAEGIVPQGGSKTVTITWDATDFDPGQSYFENLVVESNDVNNPSVTIVNEMFVYTPSQFEGTVTDINTGEPLNGVIVTAAPTGSFTDYILDDGTYENGYGYNTAGDIGSIGNLYNTTDEGYLVSVDAYLYSGAAMTVPLNIEIYDAGHNLLGVSTPILITDAGWYTFTLPNIEFSGNFYCMLHWPMLTGSTRYLGWDSNGPNSGANLSYEYWNGGWFSFLTDYSVAGVLQLRPKAFVTGQVDPIIYTPSSNGTTTDSHLAMTNIAGNSGRPGVGTSDNNTRDLAIFQTITDDQGEYSLVVDPGVYDVSFEKTAYQTLVIQDVAAPESQIITLDAQLREESYPPSFVYAEVNEDDTQVLVTWGDGSGPYEVIYDDGSAENMTAWALPGNMNAVKFTPASYPATVIGARIYVGDGSFPNNNTGFIGVTFGAMVIDDDGPNGLPGTTLDSIQVVVNNYGWVSFTGFDVELTDGNFYIAMVQGSISPNTAPIGVDEQMPIVYRSYSRNVSAGLPWGLSPYQDFMMRAIIYGNPSGDNVIAQSNTEARIPLKQRGLLSMSAPKSTAGGIEGAGLYKAALDMQDNTRSVTGYRVVRFSGFNPDNAPETGTATTIAANINGNSYTDMAWAGLPAGWYAYGVAALYPDGYISDTTVSNVVGHLIDAVVTVNVTLTTGGSPAGAMVSFTGLNYPYDVFTATVPEDGQVVFSPVYFGPYTLFASKVGFEDYEFTVNITGDRTIDVMLAERKYKPRNLYVDPLTLVATWDEPLAYAVLEDFEGAVFPPEGWQVITQNTTGWYATTDGSSGSWTIPAHTKYAVVNDDADNGNGCCDYLITNELDFTNLDSYRLNFASFFDGAFGQSAYVELSTDAGETWTVIHTMAPATAWTEIEIDLAQYSGANGLSSVWIAFHADDNGAWASGWAIDDVAISSGGVPLQGYGVFLDGTLVGNTMERTFTYTNLNYGQEYLAGVAALFSSGYSELDTYLFRSLYLTPPDSLMAVSPELTDYVHLTWNEPVSSGGGAGGTLIEDFEAGTLPEGWLSIDEDGDGYKWDNSAIEFSVFDAHTGAYCMASASYRNDVGPLNPNN